MRDIFNTLQMCFLSYVLQTDFPEIKVFTEAWTEIRHFIRNIDEGAQIVSKAERVYWDGSRDEIAEEEYIAMAPDQATPQSKRLIQVT